MDLIEILKQEHREILEQANRVIKGGFSTDSTKKNIEKFKTLLTEHLKKEDDIFYPYLQEVAKINSPVKIMLHIYAQELDKLISVALKFFDDFETGKLTSIQAAKEFGSISGQLKSRISNEEKQLFLKYTELKNMDKKY